jgi:rod shape-determining protein MreC
MGIKDSAGLVSNLAHPIKTVAQRFTYVALVVSSFCLIMFGRIDPIFVERFRVSITDGLTPLLNVTSRLTSSIFTLAQEVIDLNNTRKSNGLLIEENNRLLKWQALAKRLEVENKALHDLLNFVPSRKANFIAARIIADTSGAFANSVVLNAGKNESVQKGQAAVTGEGLIGRVSGVGFRSARILLVTDLNSRIPVIIQPRKIRAILAGDNSNYPKLIHLSPGINVEQGEQIVTSGHGGVFPPGLPVGFVKSVDQSLIKVRLFADHKRASYVRVLDYGTSGIVEMPLLKLDPQRPTRILKGGKKSNED